ncbi:hypothetical protein G9A89_019078 [Geosiphon pyriformis]|nr:hypothetical protein G9A89_019078 [Geosiphon pyriformis]
MAIDKILTDQIALNKSGCQAEKKIGHNCNSKKTTTITTESLSTKTFRSLSTAISSEHQVTGLLFNSTTKIITCIILQRTSTDNTKSKKISSLLGTPINKEIKHHTQQRYPITYTSKSKEKLQTPAVIPRKIQPPVWKKNRVESPSNPSYHYTPGSTINISSTDARQKKTELLGLYGEYFEGFNSQSSTPSGFQLPLPPPDFGISDPWEAVESEKEEEESEDQEFTYQHPIIENPEVETLNLQTQQQNQKSELLNQQNLPPIIIINQPPINLIAEPIQQPLQLPLQQPGQQQLLQQPLQPPNLYSMAYAPIAKLDNFTAPQILNQFIRGLHSSILQHVRPLYPSTLQDAVTCTRDFESMESEANHAQAVNLVMNGSSELDSKLEKFSESINKRLKGYLADNHAIYQPPQRCNNQGNSNHGQNQPHPSLLTNQQ